MKIAISVGDLNGVGIAIALKAHNTISQWCKPIYCINGTMLEQACRRLNVTRPSNMILSSVEGTFEILPGHIDTHSGKYSFDSFYKAIILAQANEVDAIVTLPIHKEAWSLADLPYKGHTDYLRKHFNKEAIMMLGCEELFVALYTEHTPLKEVPKAIDETKITRFLLDLVAATRFERIGVLGLNPHAGDGGVLGDEETIIAQAIENANTFLKRPAFIGPLVPDTAFTPRALLKTDRIVAMYHDQGLAPLKALYFDKSINVSLNLPIVRTSVDHGTAFDIAYHSSVEASIESYLNAVRFALKMKN